MRRVTKRKSVEIISGVMGMGGLITIVLGGGACLGGLSATGIIKFGEFLSPHRLTYQKMIFYGSASVGAGLFLTGAGIGIARLAGERMAQEELQPAVDEVGRLRDEQLQQSHSECTNCKYYSGEAMLLCAVHPTLKQNCPDWASKDETSNNQTKTDQADF